ncbi:hypothetical protein MTsPCn7_12560 [Altererythrobacter sp. MTPC7]
MRRYAILLGPAIMLGGCATGSASQSDRLAAMMAGESAVSGAALDAAVQDASAQPLGSMANPVRAEMPRGQRAYLSRLRCADLKAPEFSRLGSFGNSPYGNIMDGYEVVCSGSEPAERTIYMDMYHRGHVEQDAVEGYGIVGGRESGPEG